MKICIISGLYPPYSKGGAEAVAQNAAAEFKSAGHEVFVITAQPFKGLKSLFPKAVNENGIIVYRFFPLNFFFYGNIGKYPFPLRALWHVFDLWNIHAGICLAKIIGKIYPDLVMTHNLKGFGLIVPSTLYSTRTDKEIPYKWIHTLHDVQVVSPSGLMRLGDEDKWSNKLFSVISRALFISPDMVASPSAWLLDFYTERGFFPKSEKKVVPNPIRIKHLPAGKQGQEVRIKNSNFTFLYLGQLELHKGVLFLIDTFKKFLEIHPECELWIAGDGSKKKEVETAALGVKQIQYLGSVPQERVSELFAKVNATVAPSLVLENAPSVISESLAYGVPVIASRLGGIPEMVEDGKNGLLFNPGDESAFISAISESLKNQFNFSARGGEQSKFSSQNYSSQIASAVLK